MRRIPLVLFALLVAAPPAGAEAPGPKKPRQVRAKAYHVLPETHSDESGYFSLCEGNDGSIYIGTAKYGRNAYLVEFDPRTETQRVVIDVNKLCGLAAAGYAAQAKIHTRNFVGPSGKVYVGSKQGYRRKGDTSTYPGGYLMTYDPRTGVAENLGMPMAGQGVIDVAADEKRGLIYVVTCEEQHWMLYDRKTRKFRRLGPILTPYASTLVDARGRAYAITKDFKLAEYDPDTGKLTVRPIEVTRKTPGGWGTWSFRRKNTSAIPTWILSHKGRSAYLILMNDPRLIEIYLRSKGKTVKAAGHGRMVAGPNPDSRCALSLGPNWKVYAVVRVDNDTGFGKGCLHHLARFDMPTGKIEDLGALAVKNPDFFNFPGKGGEKPPFSHGYHRLPDGTLTPLHHHMAMTVANDGTVYVTVIYPFTLLRIDAFKPKPPPPTPAEQYVDMALAKCDAAEKHLAEFTKVAEVVADRHLAGGLIGLPWNGQTLQQELMGRSGNLVHTGFERPWKKGRADAEKAKDVGIIGWDRKPGPNDAKALAALRKRGCYVIGFGPKAAPWLKGHVGLCDAFFDTGFGGDDRVVPLGGGKRAGRGNHLVNALHGWVLMAEVVAALTRRGKMPTIWKAYAYPDGVEWGRRYFRKKQFHHEYEVAPIPPGELARRFLRRIRWHLRAFRRREMHRVWYAAELIALRLERGQKTIVASTGHMASFFIGKYEDAAWARNIEVHHNVKSQMDKFAKEAPEASLVLRLGYCGMHRDVAALLKRKKCGVIHITAENPRPEFQGDPGRLLYTTIDMGYAFGDACVSIEGYPLRLFPPSGIMQVTAYECVNAEVLAGLSRRLKRRPGNGGLRGF